MGLEPFKLLQKLKSAHIRHINIEKNEVIVLLSFLVFHPMFLDKSQRFAAISSSVNLPSYAHFGKDIHVYKICDRIIIHQKYVVEFVAHSTRYAFKIEALLANSPSRI